MATTFSDWRLVDWRLEIGLCYGVSSRNQFSNLQSLISNLYYYSVTPALRNSRHTFSGVMGMSMWRTPRCERASTTALAMAGGAPTVGDSPTPLAPSGWCGEGVMVWPV